MFRSRGSGVLLHITSLPSPYGVGDMGPGAYRFADFLSEAGFSFWQILPLNPTASSLGNSPYSSFSAFAGNPLLISPDLLVDKGFLSARDIEDRPEFPVDSVDYGAVSEFKMHILRRAFDSHKQALPKDEAFALFCDKNASWINDYAFFTALKDNFHGAAWTGWPEDLRDRKKEAMEEWRGRLSEQILREKFHQFLFFDQWLALKKYCNDKNIQVIGDIPVYVGHDCSDVWGNPELFKLDEEKGPLFVSGVPPDYFSETGQLWGTPVYNWDVLKEKKYSWWIRRFEHNLTLFNIFRVDHFRGFVAYWEVSAREKTALHGKWVEAPVKDFFKTLFTHFPQLPIIAEDLGVITPDVREIMQLFGLPGMRVLLFAFDRTLPVNPYAPHNLIRNCVAYTGTHDNNTIKGWFRKEMNEDDRKRLFAYLGREIPESDIHRELIRLLMMSVAGIIIIPMQDLLGLGEEARMNYPSVSDGNWKWRVLSAQMTNELGSELYNINVLYGRT
ncbi:MAG: 4-alpha-glucanotransferase [bacterium]